MRRSNAKAFISFVGQGTFFEKGASPREGLGQPGRGRYSFTSVGQLGHAVLCGLCGGMRSHFATQKLTAEAARDEAQQEKAGCMRARETCPMQCASVRVLSLGAALVTLSEEFARRLDRETDVCQEREKSLAGW